MLTDVNGKMMKAIKVFSAVIRYLKDHLIESINQMCTGSDLDVSSVRWVITLPAIWSYSAKLFMRKAGEKVRIFIIFRIII